LAGGDEDAVVCCVFEEMESVRVYRDSKEECKERVELSGEMVL
jgi:hypothetical protein